MCCFGAGITSRVDVEVPGASTSLQRYIGMYWCFHPPKYHYQLIFLPKLHKRAIFAPSRVSDLPLSNCNVVSLTLASTPDECDFEVGGSVEVLRLNCPWY